METKNSYLNLQETIETYFLFLSEFGFTPFTEEREFLKTRFVTTNNKTILSFKTDGYGTLLWLNINETGFSAIEPNNIIIKKIAERNHACFDELIMNPFLRKEKITIERGTALKIEIEELFNQWLSEMLQILKRNSHILDGVINK